MQHHYNLSVSKSANLYIKNVGVFFMMEITHFHRSVQSQIQSKMGSILLKKTAFLIFIVLTHNSVCQCDEISEKMEAFEKRLHHLEEQNGLKERRIKDLEATKVEIVTELQSLALKWQEAENNQNSLENNQNALGTIHILRTLL